MRKLVLITALVVGAISTPAMAQVYNANPTPAFTYGSGNDYLPANSAVLTSGTSQLAVRFHEPFVVASPSSATGVYSFETGTNLACSSITAGTCSDVSLDYSFSNFLTGRISLTNLLTNQSYTTGTFILGNATLQDSFRLSSGFLASLGFNSNVNDTYRVDLTGTNSLGTSTLSAFAQLGTGATGAVPEPSTWGMMLLGFGVMGVSLRRRRRTQTLLQAA